MYNPASMSLPRVIITGASGFIGRRLLEGLRNRFELIGLARRSQARCGAPVHDNIGWFQTDIGDRDSVATAFRFIRETGGADYLIHLAAHYDFTGEDHPEYRRTNVDGTRYVLEESRSLGLKRFIFASSLAACSFPSAGSTLDELSPPDGDNVYARSKRLGEEMLQQYEDDVPSVIVRFAAVFSDWCEYSPLHHFIETWLSGAWNSRILGGRGASAIPYLHARELPSFLTRLIEVNQRLSRRQVVIASPDHTVSHSELYRLVGRYSHGCLRPPIAIPASLAAVGVRCRDLVGRISGDPPFERPWMVRYIDRVLSVDPTRSWELLDWRPRRRLYIDRRMAFLLDHRAHDPLEWEARNRAAMKRVHLRHSLRVHRLVEEHQDEIRSRFLNAVLGGDRASPRFTSIATVSPQVMAWRVTVALRHILNSIRAEDRGLFLAYCRDLACKRLEERVPPDELVQMLRLLNSAVIDVIGTDPAAAELEDAIEAHLTMTIELGCDQILEVYEDLSGEEIPDVVDG